MPSTISDIASQSRGSRIFGLTVVRDEADIIEFCLRYASQFCERIFVLDHQSEDSTWPRVHKLADRGEGVVPVGRIRGPYARGHKAYLFKQTREYFSDGDWVLILDADEFLDVDPRPLVRNCEEEDYDAIRFLQAQFFVTDLDLESGWFLRAGNEPISSFEVLPSHYRIDHSENRMFRYSDDVVWPVKDDNGNFAQRGFPLGPWNLSPRMPVNRHYQYRSKAQMRKRLAIRAEANRETGCFKHNSDAEWMDYVQDHQGLNRLSSDEEITPTLRERVRLWKKRHSVGRRLRRAGRRVLASLGAG